MTRAYQCSSSNKTSLKRSTPCDFRYSPRKNELSFALTLPSSPSSVSCLNDLFADLCVAKSGRKQNLGRFHLFSKSRRCVHLASLIEKCSTNETRTTSLPNGGRLLHPQEQNCDSHSSYSKSQAESKSLTKSPKSQTCFPFNTRPIEMETTSTWGHFVEAEDDHNHQHKHRHPVE